MVALALGLMAAPALADPCAPDNAPDPADTIQALFDAASAGDKAAVNALLAPDFFAIDGGRRYDQDGFAGLVDTLRESGATMTWSVGSPQSERSCDAAWLTWDNQGTRTDEQGTRALHWLESAVLVWQNGRWAVAMFHSTPLNPHNR